jgi:hypothetical protein
MVEADGQGLIPLPLCWERCGCCRCCWLLLLCLAAGRALPPELLTQRRRLHSTRSSGSSLPSRTPSRQVQRRDMEQCHVLTFISRQSPNPDYAYFYFQTTYSPSTLRKHFEYLANGKSYRFSMFDTEALVPPCPYYVNPRIGLGIICSSLCGSAACLEGRG